MLEFTLRLAANRCFSNSTHDVPPFCYAPLFSADAASKQRVMSQMRLHSTILFGLENIASTSPAAASLLRDLEELMCPAVRVLYLCFERDKWRPSSPSGKRVLSTMLSVLPDTKCVEDTHQHLRDLQRQGRSLVSSKVSRTRACVDCGVIEGRVVEHKKVQKEEFLHKYRNKFPSVAGRFKVITYIALGLIDCAFRKTLKNTQQHKTQPSGKHKNKLKHNNTTKQTPKQHEHKQHTRTAQQTTHHTTKDKQQKQCTTAKHMEPYLGRCAFG